MPTRSASRRIVSASAPSSSSSSLAAATIRRARGVSGSATLEPFLLHQRLSVAAAFC
jgi:hypothetical protein